MRLRRPEARILRHPPVPADQRGAVRSCSKADRPKITQQPRLQTEFIHHL
jgi:hypothetical protein